VAARDVRRLVNAAIAAAFVALVWATLAARLPQGLPSGIVLQGVVIGALNGLLAIGLVLVYRTSRIINFAQGSLGAFSAVLAFELMAVAGWPWIAAVPLSIVAAVLVAAALEFTTLRRLQRAPRLIATVATIGLAQILIFLELVLQPLFERGARGVSAVGSRFPSPFDGHAFDVFPVVFRWDHVVILIVVPVVLVALTTFLSRTWIGIGVRGVAENADRAGLLGVPAPRLSTYIWAIAGLLSAVTAILRAPVIGFATSGSAGPGLILRGLAAAAIGRMTNMPVTFAAAVGLGIVEQGVFFNYARTGPMDALLVGVILVAFLAQRRRAERSGWAEPVSWQAAANVRAIPTELRRLPEVVRTRWGAGAALVGLAMLPPLVLGLDTIRLLAVIYVFAIVGVSLVVTTGWAGQISLGQWGIAGTGGFCTAWLANHTDVDFIVVLVCAGLVGAVVSIALGLPAMRIRGIFAGVTTLAFAIAAESWFFSFDWLDPGARVARPALFGRISLVGEKSFYYVVLATLLIVVLAGHNIRNSRVGRLLIAARDNEQAAASFGVSIFTARLWAFGIAGFMAAVGGGVYTYLIQQASPRDFSAVTSLFLFAIVVIGGLGSIAGALAGAAYVQGAQYLLPTYASFFATGIGMLVLLILLPGGLSQLIYQARDNLLRRVGERRDIVVPALLADVREDATR
jgi:branched-chain amino acid transport system permease protein